MGTLLWAGGAAGVWGWVMLLALAALAVLGGILAIIAT